MKGIGFALWLLAIAAAFAAGRMAPREVETDDWPVRPFGELVKERDYLDRSNEISRFFLEFGENDVDAVKAIIEERQYWLDENDLHMLMIAWTRFDGPGAVDWAISQRGRFRNRASEAAIEAMAFHSPPGARALMDTLDVQELISPLHKSMVTGWANSEFRESLYRYSLDLPPSVERQQAIKALVVATLKDGMDSLADWLDAIPDDAPEHYKRIAFRKASDAIASLDHESAADWIEGYQGKEYAEKIPVAIAGAWSRRDSGAALTWLASIPITEERADKVKTIYASWLRTDREAAVSWLYAAAPAEGVDPAVRWMVRQNGMRDPKAALDWAHLIHVGPVRLNVLKSVSRAWYNRDPKAFQEWLPESGLEIELGTELPFMRPADQGDGEAPNS